MHLSFDEQIKNIRATPPPSIDVQNKRLIAKLSSGIKNHILSLASHAGAGRKFSCSFYICFGSVEIDVFRCAGLDTDYISVIMEKDLSVNSIWSEGQYVIQLNSEAIGLRNSLETSLKSNGIVISDFLLAELVFGGDITDGDYRIGWRQGGDVGFSINEISRKQSPIFSTSIFDKSTLVPYGERAIKVLGVNANQPVISNHQYRKTLFSYKAKSYLSQGNTNFLFQNEGRGYGSQIAYCVKISYDEP